MTHILYTKTGRTGFITLNRPEKRNALNHEMVAELREAFANAEDDPDVKVIILKAVGTSFCAGADLAYLQKLQKFSTEENRTDSNHLKDLLLQIYTLNKIVIAQVQGHALAGGCGLASVCDFIVTVPEARFGYTEVKIGFIPAIVMVFLLRKIGEGHAKQFLLAGTLVSADEAFRMGLVSKIVTSQNLEDSVTSFAEELINSNSAQAMATTKQMISRIPSMPLLEALNYAVDMNVDARSTVDCKRGVAAFLNKEDLAW